MRDRSYRHLQAAGAAVLLSSALTAQPGLASLNQFEEAAGGEFGTGTALQYGSADAIGEKFDGQVRNSGPDYSASV